jgi:hypothetical protein
MEGAAAPIDIKKLVNQIFSRRGAPEVKNFPKEFADGSKYYWILVCIAIVSMFLIKNEN